jgi:hypothetical protein
MIGVRLVHALVANTLLWQATMTMMLSIVTMRDCYYGPTEFVMISGFGQPLAGRVLMLGSTADGDSTDVNTNAVEMLDKVQFLSHEDVMEMYA